MTINPLSIALGVAAALLLAALLWRLLRRKPSSEELERRRRAALSRPASKLGDVDVIDVDGAAVVYSYAVRGVGYTASRMSRRSSRKLPENTMTLIGPLSVKFDPRNPANFDRDLRGVERA